MSITAIDLFCGAGGMSEGIIQAGFHILFSSDINREVELTYVNRHSQLGLIQGKNTFFLRKDIKEIEGKLIKKIINNLVDFKKNQIKEEIDAVFGGPPCQGFSRAGKRDKNDPRNLLFKEYIRIINEIHPKYVVMENVEGFMDTRLDDFEGVTGLKYGKNELIPDILINEFKTIGYSTLEPQILDASDFGVPQRRKRAIFIAYLNNLPTPYYPTPTVAKNKKITVFDAIGDLIINEVLREQINKPFSQYQKESKIGRTKTIQGFTVEYNNEIFNHDTSNHYQYIKERFSLYKEGETTLDLKNRILKEGIDLVGKANLLNNCYKMLNAIFTKEELIRSYKSGNVSKDMLNALLTKKNNRIRLNRKDQSPTIVTMPDDYISPFENRVLTVREMARLQSFDDSFEFLGKRTTGGDRRRHEIPQYTQVGNAIPPLLSRAVALEIKRALKNI